MAAAVCTCAALLLIIPGSGRSVNGTDPGIGGTITLCAGFNKVPKYSIIIWDFVSESTQRIAECLRLPGRSNIRYSGDTNLRLNLNRINASLTITDLKTTDSGTYLNTVLNKAVTRDFQLRVLAPVSKPHIRKLGKSSGVCWVQCTVKNGEGVNLSWYRGNKRISNTSSSDIKINLTLPLNISEYISTYRCVASNPAGNLTVQFNKDALCTGSSVTHVFWLVIAIVILLFVGIILFGKFLKKQKYCVL
ncbi:T-lymphocyte surface antigen Ly-9-like isoform X2 [Astyanax mexicanus]|uniref:T-lymphocyte surface antigen Ly-9-like isoform X2 n=1 Tax=Astyanax mexicanus TaxID=7994 RepID=UPI0020CB1A17|nr:T-lymphocyte surface antigen Ly-9-like isoform X2 [Astyanax mexicanus]